MILTLTPNPSLDRTVSLPGPLQRGAVQRLTGVVMEPGGKGVNVARVLSNAGRAATTVLLVVAVMAVFGGMMVWSGLELVAELPKYADRFQQIVLDVSHWLNERGVTPDMVSQQLASIDMSTVTGTAVSAITKIATNVYAVFGLLVTVIMGMFFLAMDSMDVERRVRLLSTARHEFGHALVEFAQGVRRYWVVATIFGLIVAILDVVALAIIDVPLVWVWGVLAFLTNYIPNIGFVIGHEDQWLVFTLTVSRHSRPFRTRVAVLWRPPALLPDPLPRPARLDTA